MDIKIIGSNCSNGMKLKKELKRAIEKVEIEIALTENNEEGAKKKYHIQNIPALVIDNTVVSQGKVLSEREIFKLINQTFYSNVV